MSRRDALLAAAERLANMGSWEWTPETGELLWSDNLFRIFGLQPGQVTPTVDVVVQAAHPDDREHVRARVDEAARVGVLPPLDYRIVTPAHAVRHLRATMARSESEPGAPRRLVGTVQDLTERRRAEREIEAHLGVAETLAQWSGLEQGAHLLLRNLGDALEVDAGVFWLEQDGALVPRVSWALEDVDVAAVEAMARAGQPDAPGLTTQVWDSLEPGAWNAAPGARDDPRRPAAAELGLRGAIAFPAIGTEEVLAVVELFSRAPIEPTRRLVRTLLGLGTELGHFLERHRGQISPPALTPREAQVLQLAAHGSSGRRIAEQLVVSPATVKTHFENIYAKLGVSDRASAVATALRLGFIR